jgi:nucleotide-binding universal stress UspA family protein
MQTILVPTDFSETSKNVAIYAIALAKQIGASKIILYNAYEIIMPAIGIDQTFPSAMPIDIEVYKNISNSGLTTFTKNLEHLCDNQVVLETKSDFNTLVNGISEAVITNHVDLVIMGVTGGNALEESLIGSNAVDVAKEVTVPMIIVPPNAVFKQIEEITLAVDLKKVAATTPTQPIKTLLDIVKAKLFVLHVNDGEDEDDKDDEMDVLSGLLQGYNPEYFFVNNVSFIDGINDFVDSKNVDLIVTIPKKHGWFESLFTKSHTKILAFHSHVPLMVIHD